METVFNAIVNDLEIDKFVPSLGLGSICLLRQNIFGFVIVLYIKIDLKDFSAKQMIRLL